MVTISFMHTYFLSSLKSDFSPCGMIFLIKIPIMESGARLQNVVKRKRLALTQSSKSRIVTSCTQEKK